MKRFTVIVGALLVLLAMTPGFTMRPAAKAKTPRFYTAGQVPTDATWPNDGSATNLLSIFTSTVGFDQEILRLQGAQCDLIKNGSPGTMDNESCALGVNWSNGIGQYVNIFTGKNHQGVTVRAPGDFSVKYYVGSQACSGWIAPFDAYSTFELDITNPCLNALDDGFFDISVDVQSGSTDLRPTFTFATALVFLYRGSPHTFSNMVPLQGEVCGGNYCRDIAAGIYSSPVIPSRLIYVDVTSVVPRAHPCRPDVMGVAWTAAPNVADIYQDEAMPHTDLFTPSEMPWQLDSRYPVQAKYFFNISPKTQEQHNTLYGGGDNVEPHVQLPFRDGGRGVAWASNLIGGYVDAAGDFYFAEPGGPFREMHRDCSIDTIWGWTLTAGKYNVFPRGFTGDTADRDAHTARVHENMTYIGDVQEGENTAPYTGAHTPLDVAPGPVSESHLMPGYQDNVIWFIEEGAGAGGQARVTVAAGSTSHTAGFVDGDGHAVRFNGPTSIVKDAVCSCWYIADQNNDRIRKMTYSAGTFTVTTFAGHGAGTGTGVGTGTTFDALDDNFTLTGTIDFTSNSADVLGHGTSFLTELSAEAHISRGSGTPYIVASVTDDTHLVLDSTDGYHPLPASTFNGQTGIRLGSSWANTEGLGGAYFQQLARSSAQGQSTYRYTVNATQAAAGKRPEIFFPMAVRTTSTGDVCTLDLGFGGIRCINPSTYVTRHITREFARLGGTGQTITEFGWAFMDVDKWGNSGPLDGIYYIVFQSPVCANSVDSHTNESYCWAPTTGDVNGVTRTNEGILYFDDQNANPDGWGPIGQTDPPHYGWTNVIDPHGGVYMAGGGEMGITRLRVRQAFDPLPPSPISNNFYGEIYSKLGGCSYCISFINRFGSNGHNYTGMPDLWDYQPSASDATLIAAFDLDEAGIDAQDDAGAQSGIGLKAKFLQFMRNNMGPPIDAPPGDTPGALKAHVNVRIHGDPDYPPKGPKR